MPRPGTHDARCRPRRNGQDERATTALAAPDGPVRAPGAPGTARNRRPGSRPPADLPSSTAAQDDPANQTIPWVASLVPLAASATGPHLGSYEGRPALRCRPFTLDEETSRCPQGSNPCRRPAPRLPRPTTRLIAAAVASPQNSRLPEQQPTTGLFTRSGSFFGHSPARTRNQRYGSSVTAKGLVQSCLQQNDHSVARLPDPCCQPPNW